MFGKNKNEDKETIALYKRENNRLRIENERLRADRDALKKYKDEYEALNDSLKECQAKYEVEIAKFTQLGIEYQKELEKLQATNK